MKLHHRFLQLALTTSISILPLSMGDTLFAEEETKLNTPITLTQDKSEQDETVEKGFSLRGKRGHRGHRGKRGHAGQTGPQGPQGEPGTGYSPVYSIHYGVSSFYTISSEGAQPIVFTTGGFNPNVDNGGLTFDSMTGEVIINQSGLYELHADVSFLTNSVDFVAQNAYTELTFITNGTPNEIGAVEMSRSILGTYSSSAPYTLNSITGARLTGSLASARYLTAGDRIGVAVIARDLVESMSATLDSGLVSFSVKLLDSSFTPVL